jgi:PAS domain S-box-containing protein
MPRKPSTRGRSQRLAGSSAGGDRVTDRDEASRAGPDRAALERAEQLAQTGTWEWDVDTGVLLWSENMFRLLGVEPGSVVPTPEYVIGRVHPDDRDRVEREVELARRDGSLPDPVYRTIWPDGTLHVLRSFAAVASEQEGPPRRFVSAVQDVTALAESQRHTAESLTLMETLQQAAPVGFAFVDRDCRIVRINETLAEVNGAPPGEHIGRTIAEMVPDVWAQMEQVYRRVLETGEPAMNIEVERQRQGEPDFRHWLASYYPVRVDGDVLGLGIIVTDITERQELEHFRAAVMDTMVEGLYALDDQGCLTFMNSAASKLLGRSEEELLGKSVHAAIHFQHAHQRRSRRGGPSQARARHPCLGWSHPGRARPRPVCPLLTADRSPRRRPAQPRAATTDARTGRRDHRAWELPASGGEVRANRRDRSVGDRRSGPSRRRRRAGGGKPLGSRSSSTRRPGGGSHLFPASSSRRPSTAASRCSIATHTSPSSPKSSHSRTSSFQGPDPALHRPGRHRSHQPST